MMNLTYGAARKAACDDAYATAMKAARAAYWAALKTVDRAHTDAVTAADAVYLAGPPTIHAVRAHTTAATAADDKFNAEQKVARDAYITAVKVAVNAYLEGTA